MAKANVFINPQTNMQINIVKPKLRRTETVIITNDYIMINGNEDIIKGKILHKGYIIYEWQDGDWQVIDYSDETVKNFLENVEI